MSISDKEAALSEVKRVAPVDSHVVDIEGRVFEVVRYNDNPHNTVTVSAGAGGTGGNQLTWSIADFVKMYRPISKETAHKIISQGHSGQEVYRSAPRIGGHESLLDPQISQDPQAGIGAYKDRIASLEHCLEECRASLRQAEADRDELGGELDELNSDYEQVLQQLEEEKEKKVVRVEHSHKDLVLERDLLQRRVTRSRGEIARLRNMVDDLEAENEDLLSLLNKTGRSPREPICFPIIRTDFANAPDYSEQINIKVPPQAGDEINHPSHYTSDPSGVECNTIRENWCSNLADALKYLWRHGQKPGEDATKDLRKAMKYIEFEIERIQRNGNN